MHYPSNLSSLALLLRLIGSLWNTHWENFKGKTERSGNLCSSNQVKNSVKLLWCALCHKAICLLAFSLSPSEGINLISSTRSNCIMYAALYSKPLSIILEAIFMINHQNHDYIFMVIHKYIIYDICMPWGYSDIILPEKHFKCCNFYTEEKSDKSSLRLLLYFS